MIVEKLIEFLKRQDPKAGVAWLFIDDCEKYGKKTLFACDIQSACGFVSKRTDTGEKVEGIGLCTAETAKILEEQNETK